MLPIRRLIAGLAVICSVFTAVPAFAATGGAAPNSPPAHLVPLGLRHYAMAISNHGETSIDIQYFFDAENFLAALTGFVPPEAMFSERWNYPYFREFVDAVTLAEGRVMVTADGRVTTTNLGLNAGDLEGQRITQSIVGLAASATGGYWMVASDGGVFAFGNARFYGSLGNQRLNSAIIDIKPTPSGLGYWLLAGDGGVFAFGDARFYGSATGQIAQPATAIAPTLSGRGYWITDYSGQVTGFGDATVVNLQVPLIGTVDITADPDGGGYWLLASTSEVQMRATDFYSSYFDPRAFSTGRAIALNPLNVYFPPQRNDCQQGCG